MKAFKILFLTELKLSWRGLDMVIFALALPVVVMVMIGLLFGQQAAFTGAAYTFAEQSFGAVSTIAVCAGGVMGLPLVIADARHRKLFKRFWVTPASPQLLLAVYLAVYAFYALLSLGVVYLVAHWGFQCTLRGSWAGFLAAYLLVMLALFSLGLVIGALAKDMKKAGLWCSIAYFPMLIFSGATLPYEKMPQVMQQLADWLPLTQGIKLLKAAFLGLPLEEVGLAIAVLAGISIVCLTAAIKFFRWE